VNISLFVCLDLFDFSWTNTITNAATSMTR